nr:hypothetical protein [Actinomyces sp.]
MSAAPTTDDVLAQDLAAYVGGVPVTDYLRGCVSVARQAVDQHVRACQVPEETRARAVMEVAAELYHRKSAPNGIKSYGDLDGVAAVRVARDAMVAARPLLAPYLPLAIA